MSLRLLLEPRSVLLIRYVFLLLVLLLRIWHLRVKIVSSWLLMQSPQLTCQVLVDVEVLLYVRCLGLFSTRLHHRRRPQLKLWSVCSAICSVWVFMASCVRGHKAGWDRDGVLHVVGVHGVVPTDTLNWLLRTLSAWSHVLAHLLLCLRSAGHATPQVSLQVLIHRIILIQKARWRVLVTFDSIKMSPLQLVHTLMIWDTYRVLSHRGTPIRYNSRPTIKHLFFLLDLGNVRVQLALNARLPLFLFLFEFVRFQLERRPRSFVKVVVDCEVTFQNSVLFLFFWSVSVRVLLLVKHWLDVVICWARLTSNLFLDIPDGDRLRVVSSSQYVLLLDLLVQTDNCLLRLLRLQYVLVSLLKLLKSDARYWFIDHLLDLPLRLVKRCRFTLKSFLNLNLSFKLYLLLMHFGPGWIMHKSLLLCFPGAFLYILHNIR